jgi:hypothetical protein
MRTAKQRAASRANAQKSTGPRTAEGKRMSRFNAIKHGIYAVHQIMYDEKPEDLAELTAEYVEQFNPATAEERGLVELLVHNEWRLRRMRRIEARLWIDASGLYLIRNIDYTITATSGGAFGADSAIFERLQRVVNSCERAYHRAAHELERVQLARAQTPATQSAENHLPVLSFVPSKRAATGFTAFDAPLSGSETHTPVTALITREPHDGP